MEGTRCTEAFAELNPCDVTDSMVIELENVFSHGEYCTTKVMKFQFPLIQDGTGGSTSSAARVYPTLKNPVRATGTGGTFAWIDNPQAARVAEEYTYYRPIGMGCRVVPTNSAEQDGGTIYIGSSLPVDDVANTFPVDTVVNRVRDSPQQPSPTTLTQQKGYITMPYRSGGEGVCRMAPFTRIVAGGGYVYGNPDQMSSTPQLFQSHWNKHEFRMTREDPSTAYPINPSTNATVGPALFNNIGDSQMPHLDIVLSGLDASSVDRTVANVEMTLIICVICRDKSSTGRPERPTYLGAALAPGDMGSGRARDVAVVTTLRQFAEQQVAKARNALSVGGKVAQILAPIAGMIGGPAASAAVSGFGTAVRGLGNVGIQNSSAVIGSFFRG